MHCPPTPRESVPGRALIAAAILLLAGVSGCRKAPVLPVLREAPAFTLTTHRNQPLSRKDLAGRVWIADFIFTSCQSICPLLTARMADLQTSLAEAGPQVQFVSISVDPNTDTPKRLQAYVRKHEIDDSNWVFLTGAPEEIKNVVVHGFAQGLAPDPNRPGNILHGTHFVLVDQVGRVRGYYRTDRDGLTRLTRAARSLLQTPHRR